MCGIRPCSPDTNLSFSRRLDILFLFHLPTGLSVTRGQRHIAVFMRSLPVAVCRIFRHSSNDPHSVQRRLIIAAYSQNGRSEKSSLMLRSFVIAE